MAGQGQSPCRAWDSVPQAGEACGQNALGFSIQLGESGKGFRHGNSIYFFRLILDNVQRCHCVQLGNMKILSPSYRGKAAHERWRTVWRLRRFFLFGVSILVLATRGGPAPAPLPGGPVPLDSHASLIILNAVALGFRQNSLIFMAYHAIIMRD